MPPLLADFTHARPCKPFCEKYLTLPSKGTYKLYAYYRGETNHDGSVKTYIIK